MRVRNMSVFQMTSAVHRREQPDEVLLSPDHIRRDLSQTAVRIGADPAPMLSRVLEGTKRW